MLFFKTKQLTDFKKSRRKFCISIIVLSIGLFLVNYTLISNTLAKLQTTYTEKSNMGSVEQKALLKEADAYNTALAHHKNIKPYHRVTKNAFVFGYLEVPAIGINHLVEYGTGDDVLSKNLGVVKKHSLPVGGKTAHCTISGHTGMASQQMFSNLDEMQKGDLFFLHCLGRDLAYQVDGIKVVLPSEGEELNLQNGKDIVTLLTCTPYGVNTHRLLVTGHRIAYDFTKSASENGYDTKRRFTPRERLQFLLAGASTVYFIHEIRKGKKKLKKLKQLTAN